MRIDDKERPYLFSSILYNGVLYTRWRLPQERVASLGGGHRLGCSLICRLAQGQHR